MTKKYENVIIKTIARILTPFIQLFALYVIIHGHSSPGGGFQGGVILGAAFILMAISLGLQEAKNRMSEKVNTILRDSGILIFSGIGVICLFFGGNYLNYGALPLPLSPPDIRALMILLVEIGIGITVAAIIVSIFFDVSEEWN